MVTVSRTLNCWRLGHFHYDAIGLKIALTFPIFFLKRLMSYLGITCCKIGMYAHSRCFNPRTAGSEPPSHGRGGGRMTALPQRTRKLRKIATSGKRRWIGRDKFYKKYLDNFLSGQIWGHMGSKKVAFFSKSVYFRRKSQLFQEL